MAAAVVGSEDQFHCPICLDLFKEPVTTPCGHNFCKSCITHNWDVNYPYACPLCKESFYSRPILKTNTLVSEMVAQIRTSHTARAGPGEVPCDVCPEPRPKALKSCLHCVASYCQSHLEPHLTVALLKSHQLMEPVWNLKDRVCPTHNIPLEFFCRIDQSCICSICNFLHHKNHEVVSLKKESDQRRSSLHKTQAETQHLMETRWLKIQEIQRSVELSQRDADRETAAGLQAFTALMQSVQRSQDQFLDGVQEKQRQIQKQAQDLVQELEQEISELEKRISEVEQLSCSEDHFLFLQHSTALRPAAALKDWSTVSFEPETCEGTAARALSELERTLTGEIKKLVLQRVQEFAVDVTLDPDTAYAKLALSEDLKQVHHTDLKKDLPENPQRFSDCHGVLGKQSFSSGRFYFEVQVQGKTEWDLGVSRESINRKGRISLNPESGYWTIALRNGTEYYACTGTRLSLTRPPQKVGVFVDYSQGLVSFYDVDSADLIFSFTGCCFTHKLLPFCSPGSNYRGSNSSPLVVSAVKNQGHHKKTQKKRKHETSNTSTYSCSHTSGLTDDTKYSLFL